MEEEEEEEDNEEEDLDLEDEEEEHEELQHKPSARYRWTPRSITRLTRLAGSRIRGARSAQPPKESPT